VTVETVEEDPIAVCRASIAANSKSFAMASRLLTPELADRAAVIYAWCRRADDLIDGDEHAFAGHGATVAGPADPIAAVAALNAELDAIYAGVPMDDVILRAFAAVVHERQIPADYPRALLAGMAMDATDTRYTTLDELLLYCYRVASTVGLMMCHVFGLRDDAALANAAHLGIAMQLTNICRDVAEDWERQRLYLPVELLAPHGIGDLAGRLGALPVDALPREELARTIADTLAIADRYYLSGNAGISALPFRAGIAVRAASMIYARIGGELVDRGCDPLAGRAIVPGWRKGLHAAAAVVAQIALAPAQLRSPLHAPSHTVEARDVVHV